MLKSCLLSLSHPKLWAPFKDLNIFMTPFAFSRFIFWKGDHLLVLRVLEIRGSLGLRSGFPFSVNILVCAVSHLLSLWISWFALWTFWFVLWVICYCCEYLGLCCELFVIAVNIWFVLWVICYCCEYLGLCCELFVIAVNILVCAVSYLLLLWIFWFVLWVICYCCEYLGLCCELFVIAVNILVCAVSYLLLLWQLWATILWGYLQHCGGC